MAVDELLKIRQGRTTVVLGVLNDKDLEMIAKEFARVADTVIATMPRTKRAFTSEQVRKAIAPLVKETVAHGDVGEALGMALSRSKKGDTVVVGGSLYTVGEAKRWWVEHETR